MTMGSTLRSAHQALEKIRQQCNKAGNWVVDADIKGYFDNINQDKLLKLAALRITDRKILKLIKYFLRAGVIEDGQIKVSLTGTPQGGVISPLLANIYLHTLDRGYGTTFSLLSPITFHNFRQHRT